VSYDLCLEWSRFEFITDVLGVAPLGASSGDGRYFPVNHREYIQIPGSGLQSRDGNFEIHITEELREVSYLDQVQLIAWIIAPVRSFSPMTNSRLRRSPSSGFMA